MQNKYETNLLLIASFFSTVKTLLFSQHWDLLAQILPQDQMQFGFLLVSNEMFRGLN